MSERVDYDPALLVVERAQQVSSALGQFILGTSRLGGPTETVWVPVPFAAFSYAHTYDPDDNGTLIFQGETGAVAMSFWHTPEQPPLYPGDRVRAAYDGTVLFLGTVDKTTIDYTVDPQAHRHGATHRVDFSATLVGTYATALAKVVCWRAIPKEPWIDTMRRFVTVDGWD